MLLYYWLTINHVFQCAWQTAAPFTLTFLVEYWISKHAIRWIFCWSTIIKSYTLTICADDSTYQVKHSLVKCFMVVQQWICFYSFFSLPISRVILQLLFFALAFFFLVIFTLFVLFLWCKNTFIFFTHLCTSYCSNSGAMFDGLGVGDKQDYRFYVWQQFDIAHYISEYQQ